MPRLSNFRKGRGVVLLYLGIPAQGSLTRATNRSVYGAEAQEGLTLEAPALEFVLHKPGEFGAHNAAKHLTHEIVEGLLQAHVGAW
jgi:hypothetical protein